MKGWQALDHRVTEACFRVGQRTKRFWIFWSQGGFFLLLIASGGFFVDEHALVLVPVVAGVTLLTLILTVILQEILRRHRPTEELHGAYHALGLKWSFPSAHASTAWAWACSCVFGYVKIAPILEIQDGVLFLGLVMIAAFVSASRVFLGVHHVADVMAGALLGIGLSIILITL